MRRLFRLLLPFGVLAMLVLAPQAAAVHNLDQHSLNMQKLFQSPNTSGPNNTSATNSDIAFWGSRAYVGNYGGVRIYDISNPASPQLLSDFRCNGPQNDPAVWGNLMFLAIDRTQTSPNCGSTNTPSSDDPTGWEGVRIIDVSNPAAPTQVGAVYADCGAHTITLNPVSVSTIHLWVSSYPLAPGPTCGPVRGPAAGRHPHHGVIQIIEVPLANPSAAREIAEPEINYPGDPDNAFNPAEHDFPLLTMRACHDISIHTKLRIAAAACAEQAQLWRIGADGMPDTANPIWVTDEVDDSDGPGGGDVAVDFWHSATFSWDGKIINFIDESFGSGCPTVTPIGLVNPKPSDTGYMFFYDRAGNKLSQLRNPRRTGNYCSAHLGNVVPAIGQYLIANAWYTGGSNVVDFTNPRLPREVAHYYTARNPASGTPVITPAADTWSHYWYENQVGDDNGMWTYGNDIPGGFQVFRVTMPVVDIALSRMNPQTQEDVFQCRITLSPGSLRAGQARMVRATARLRPGTTILPNQAVASVPIRFRGPGVNANLRTNANGVARLGVNATGSGRLRVSIPNVPNMRGCTASARIAAAPRRGGSLGAGTGGAGLTGRLP